jgi:hypothetical protein
VLDRRRSMRDRDDRRTVRHRTESGENALFGFGIERIGGFVEK